jgi:hypothetical protein
MKAKIKTTKSGIVAILKDNRVFTQYSKNYMVFTAYASREAARKAFGNLNKKDN